MVSCAQLWTVLVHMCCRYILFLFLKNIPCHLKACFIYGTVRFLTVFYLVEFELEFDGVRASFMEQFCNTVYLIGTGTIGTSEDIKFLVSGPQVIRLICIGGGP